MIKYTNKKCNCAPFTLSAKREEKRFKQEKGKEKLSEKETFKEILKYQNNQLKIHLQSWTISAVLLTLDSTSALWSFCRSRAAALVSSLRAAMCRAGRRTLPFVSFSSSKETTWSWPCWRATARGVKPSCT